MKQEPKIRHWLYTNFQNMRSITGLLLIETNVISSQQINADTFISLHCFDTFVPDKKKNKMKRKNFKIFPSFSNVYYLARLKMFNLGYYSNKEEEGLEQSKSQSEDQTVCVPGLCTQHSPLQQ